MQNTRNTIQRQMVMDAVQALHCHPTAEEIYAYVAQRYPHISKGTVYRNLSVLCSQGDVLRVSHLDGADRFDFNLHPHYHFCCKSCQGVYDVPLPHSNELLERGKALDGFVFEECHVTFSGVCPTCAAHQNQVPTGA